MQLISLNLPFDLSSLYINDDREVEVQNLDQTDRAFGVCPCQRC